MTNRIFISAEYDLAGTIRCEHCIDNHATHIELSPAHTHNPNEHLVVCAACAYLAGLSFCKACASKLITVQAGKVVSDMIRTYDPTLLIDQLCLAHENL